MASPLSTTQLEQVLATLPCWAYTGGKLTKTFKLADFSAALGFIVRIGLEAQVRDHHPELFNVYATVKIELSTHDAGGQVTQKDVDLAQAIERLSKG